MYLLCFNFLVLLNLTSSSPLFLVLFIYFFSAVSEITPAWVNLSIFQRIAHYDWSKEGFILLAILAFVSIHFFFLSTNKKKVNEWVSYQKSVLDQEFAQVGVSSDPKDPIVLQNSPILFSTFVTGRENIESIYFKFSLIGRHNPFSLALEYILSFFFSLPTPEDLIRLDIAPNVPITPLIFAIVNKNFMQSAREDNYYLTLTKTSDSEKLPPSFVFMSESSELTQLLYSQELNNAVHSCQSFLRTLVVTDQSENKPKTVADLSAPTAKPKLILTLDFPQSAQDKEACAKLLQATIAFIDDLALKSQTNAIRPEIQRKIKATRDAEIKKIQKAADQERADELLKKKDEEKREQRSKISKLSAKEQLKAEQKEREREQRKMRNKQSKKM